MHFPVEYVPLWKPMRRAYASYLWASYAQRNAPGWKRKGQTKTQVTCVRYLMHCFEKGQISCRG